MLLLLRTASCFVILNEEVIMREDSIKTLEIGIAVILFPYLFRLLNIAPTPIVDGLGVFIAAIVVYWLPPPLKFSFIKWSILALLIAIIVYLLSNMIIK
jgi:hypothetical protein